MFNLNKEIDEIRLEYYILNTAKDGLIELTLSEIAILLNVSKSKAQRLVEKFIKLRILEIQEKSKSKNNKTLYKYMKYNNVDTYINTDKTCNIEVFDDMANTNTETKVDIIEIYKKKFKLNTAMSRILKQYEDDFELELFEYLIDHISDRNDLKSKEAYLLKLLKDLKTNKVKDIEGFFKHTEKHKKQVQKQKLAEKWGYTPVSDEHDTDFDKLAEMTRYR